MSLFALADLHLSLSTNKPMDIFPGWEGHTERIRKSWTELVKPDDTVVCPGDISWGMNMEQARADLDFINALPGTKIISKGNHDYWWNTASKMNRFFEENGFSTLHILHNNFYRYENYGICGTRGWINDNSEPFDAKIIAREAHRLEASVRAAAESGLEPLVFLHYPPLFADQRNDSIMDVLHRYGIKRCYYGHLHGRAHRLAVTGMAEEIDFRLIAADYLKFIPYKIL